MTGVDQPGANTVGAPERAGAGRSRAPWEFKVLLSFVGVLAVGIVLAWTLVGSRSPERLEPAAAAGLSAACNDAQAQLEALPNPFPRTGPDRLARIRAENDVLRAMVRRFADVRPDAATPAAAVRGWSDDWTKVLDARDRYASDLETKRSAAARPAGDAGAQARHEEHGRLRAREPPEPRCVLRRCARAGDGRGKA